MNPFTPAPIKCAAAGPVSALERSALRQWFASLGAVRGRFAGTGPGETDRSSAAVVAFPGAREQLATSPHPAATDDRPSPTPAA